MTNIKIPPMVNPFPVTQQDYRRYLPTAYDSSMNIYETLVAMREYLNQLIASQNELIKQWVELQQWINETLETYTREQIEKMLFDGTFDELINDKLFKDLEDRMNNRVNQAVKDMNDKVNSIVSASPVDVVETVTQLNEKYPNGRTGIVVVKEDGYYYYYQDNTWKKGALYIDPVTYPLVKKDGTATNLNLSTSWRDNPDITTLKSGYYSAFIQNNPTNPNYPVAINFPPNIDGNICLIRVIDLGNEGRMDYRVTINAVNTSYSATKTLNGSMSEWAYVVEHSESRPKQQYQLTFADGTTANWKYGTTNANQQLRDDLIVPLNTLNSKFYFGAINKLENGVVDERGLPTDAPLGQFYNAIIWRTASNRRAILLTATFSGLTWMGNFTTNGGLISWKRLDKDVDVSAEAKDEFVYRVNGKTFDARHLVITDIHGQLYVGDTQIREINPEHYKNFNELEKRVKGINAGVCLGDWIDGNYLKKDSINSMVHFSNEFFSKEKRYGVYGNHDFNCQWDGNAGNNKEHEKDPNYLLDKKDVLSFFTPKGEAYYYVDDINTKIRSIYLASFDFSYKIGADGKYITNPLNQRMIGGDQIRWFVKTLKSVPTGFNVVIYSHESFDNIFKDEVYYNGDTARRIAEGYQAKTKDTYGASDITETDPDYDYFKCGDEFDFRSANGKILAVVSGHRHVDETIFKAGIRYISLLCSRAESGSTPSKPKRNYYDYTSDAISLLDYDIKNQKINLYRFGAGQDYTFNMFS